MLANPRARKAAVLFVIILAEIIVLGVMFARYCGKRAQQAAEEAQNIQSGRTYVESLESRDLSSIQQQVMELERARQEAAWREMKEELVNGDADVWSFLSSSVIMGDSRAVGFYLYGFLPEHQVFAGAGNTIRKIEEDIDNVAEINPSELFLCYGINDHSIGFWSSGEEYAAEYLEILNTLRQALPDTDIYVVSTLPANATGIATESSWATIPEWNDVLEEMCAENGYGFVDCSELMEEHADLYDIDGIHVQYSLYPYWAAEMVMAMYESEQQA